MLKFMKNKILIPLLIIGCLAVFFSFKYNGGPRSSEDKRKLTIEMMMNAISVVHYSPKPLDDTFSSRVYHKMLTDFDYEKIYFTRQDIKKLGIYEFKIDDEIKSNSLEFFDTLDAIYTRRVAGAEKYYKEFLTQPFTFKDNDEIQLVPAKIDYAANESELADRWREHLKYRVLIKFVELKEAQEKKLENKDSVNVKVLPDDTLEAQSRESIKKSYEQYFKRYRTM